MTRRSTCREVQTRVEAECDFLFKVATTENEKKFQKLIEKASDQQIAAILEVIVNRDLFVCPFPHIQCDCGVDISKIIPFNITRRTNFRINILNNWREVRHVLAEAANEIYLTEANKFILMDWSNESAP